MKKYFLLICFAIFSFAFGQSQDYAAIKVNFIPMQCDQFLGYDQYGFRYFIKDNVLNKTNGTESFEYKNISLGTLSKVDLLNPLTIVLFYDNFNTVVLLDNQLNEMQKINFSDQQVAITIGAVGLAAQNQLWIFDLLSQQLGLFDYLKKEYRFISVPFLKTVIVHQTNFNTFYWVDQENNLNSCDLYGKIKLVKKLPAFDAIQLIDDQKYLYSKDNVLIYNDDEKSLKFEIAIAEKTFKKFCYKDQILSIFTTEGITNYKITIP